MFTSGNMNAAAARLLASSPVPSAPSFDEFSCLPTPPAIVGGSHSPLPSPMSQSSAANFVQTPMVNPRIIQGLYSLSPVLVKHILSNEAKELAFKSANRSVQLWLRNLFVDADAKPKALPMTGVRQVLGIHCVARFTAHCNGQEVVVSMQLVSTKFLYGRGEGQSPAVLFSQDMWRAHRQPLEPFRDSHAFWWAEAQELLRVTVNVFNHLQLDCSGAVPFKLQLELTPRSGPEEVAEHPWCFLSSHPSVVTVSGCAGCQAQTTFETACCGTLLCFACRDKIPADKAKSQDCADFYYPCPVCFQNLRYLGR